MKAEELRKIKAEKFMNELCRTSKGIMTRKAWVKMKKDDGLTVEAYQHRQWEKEEKESKRLARVYSDMPFGNEKHPICIKYYEDKAKLEAGFFVERYAFSDGVIINKTEYDYYENI